MTTSPPLTTSVLPVAAWKESQALRIVQGMDRPAEVVASPTPTARPAESPAVSPAVLVALALLVAVVFVGSALVLGVVLDRPWVVYLAAVVMVGAAALLAVKLDRRWFVALIAAWRRRV